MPTHRLPSVGIAALVVITSLAQIAPAQCNLDWLPGHPPTLPAGAFRAAALLDPDGAGPANADLYVGGQFDSLGWGQPQSRNLARWDGAAWRPVISTINFSGTVNSLASFDFDADGPQPPRLVVGGTFTTGFPPNTVNRVGVVNGPVFLPLGDGFQDSVNALLVADPDADGPLPPQLYAGGAFRFSGTRSVESVARWDGAAWQRVGTNLTGAVNALVTLDLDGPGPLPTYLVAGGRVNVGGQPANVAFFDGAAWLRLGSVSDEVLSLDTFDFDADGPAPARLVAAGTFRTSNTGTVLNGQAYFDGAAWRPIVPLPQFPFITGRAIASFDPDGPGGIPPRLLLAGNLVIPGSNQPARLAALEQGTWVPIAGSSYSGDINSMRQLALPGRDDPVLFLAGTLNGPPPRTPLRLATYDGATLAPFGSGFDQTIYNLTTTTITGSPSIVAVGSFGFAPGAAARGVALFDGDHWSPMGTLDTDTGTLTAAISFDPDGPGPASESVVVGGYFDSIGGVAATNVARWNGKSWSPMGGSPALQFFDFALFDTDGPGPLPPSLISAAGIVSGGPGTPNFLRRWTGSEWVQFGPEFVSNNGPALTGRLTTFDPDGLGPRPRELVVVGFFSRVGPVLANNIAAFDGAAWRPLGSGFSTNPLALRTWDPDDSGNESIVVGGAFTTAGGVTARGAARWNGTAWSPLGDGFGASQSGFPLFPQDFVLFDHHLYAAGHFSTADGAAGNGILRWTGAAWEPLGPGLDPGAANALAILPASGARPETLCAAGSFAAAGNAPSAFFAQFRRVNCCPADTTLDGIVDSADFFLFLSRFLSLDPRADFNADRLTNSQDFFDYLAAYFHPCE